MDTLQVSAIASYVLASTHDTHRTITGCPENALGNGSYKKVCGFCTFVHTMWKGTKLHREFTSDVHSYKKMFVTFYHLITNNRLVTMHKL